MILLFAAKEKYYASDHHLNSGKLSESDSAEISNLSIKDSAFVHYLNRKADAGGMEFSVLGKCRLLIGESKVNDKYNEMIASRKSSIMDFFANEQQTTG